VEIIHDGKVLLRKGYGMADIERGVPITSRTVFDIGSTSKQFTAFAIHLLVQDGKLSLDDGMRKHLPEMHDFGKTITIRHLLQHTSGLRDSSNLMVLAGWRIDDVTTPDDQLDMLMHQRDAELCAGVGGFVQQRVLTTIEDLALWDRNFDDGRVGGKALLERMQAKGLLDSGEAFNYVPGLYVETYRGAKIVSHLGSVAGYASQMARFPDQRFTIVVLANSPDISPTATMRKIADIYLAHALAPKPVPVAKHYPAEVKPGQARLDALAGYYALSPEFVANFTVEDGRLMGQATGQGKLQLFVSGDREFFSKAVDAQFSFEAPGKDGVAARFVLHQNGRDQPGLRAPRPSLPDAAIEGHYYSEELRVLYRVEHKDGKLMLAYPRGKLPLDSAGGNTFIAGGPVGLLIFEYAPDANCTGFKASDGRRMRAVRFTKVAIVAPGPESGQAWLMMIRKDVKISR